MKRNKKLKKSFLEWLPPEEHEYLMGILRVVTFSREAVLFYKNQVPLAGHLLCEGEVTLRKGRGNAHPFAWPPGGVVGVRELIQNVPLKFNAYIKPGSRVGLLDRSTILELLNSSDEKLQRIMAKIT